MSLIERMAFVQSIFRNVWTEVRKQQGLGKPIFIFNKAKKRVVAFHQIAPLCITQPMKVKLTVMFRTTQHLKFAKIRQIDATVLKICAIECSSIA